MKTKFLYMAEIENKASSSNFASRSPKSVCVLRREHRGRYVQAVRVHDAWRGKKEIKREREEGRKRNLV